MVEVPGAWWEEFVNRVCGGGDDDDAVALTSFLLPSVTDGIVSICKIQQRWGGSLTPWGSL